MGDQKQYVVRLDRNSALGFPSAIFAREFHIREEGAEHGLVEILLSPALGGQQPHCVVFDAFILRQNYQSFVKYLAGIRDETEDAAENKKIPYSTSHYSFSNTFQASHSGGRAETLFGLTFIHDTITARKHAGSKDEIPVPVQPVLALYSTVGFQKKLLSEIFRIFKLT